MIKSRIAIAGALLAAAGVANAGEFSVTPTIASDYDWRGFSQTNEDLDGDFGAGVAFQLGANYDFGNGFYVGAWGSNVEFAGLDADAEIDVFAGYAGGDSEDGIGYDVGVNTYNYVGESDLNFFEVYAGISHGPFSGKVWYTPKYAGDLTDDPGLYVEGNVAYPVSGVSILGHVGYSSGDGVKAAWGDNYFDYSVGVGYTVNMFDLSLKYISTDVDGYDDDKVVLSVSTTFPW